MDNKLIYVLLAMMVAVVVALGVVGNIPIDAVCIVDPEKVWLRDRNERLESWQSFYEKDRNHWRDVAWELNKRYLGGLMWDSEEYRALDIRP